MYRAPYGYPRNHGKFWARREDQRLIRLTRMGMSLRTIARKLGRTRVAIMDRQDYLGV